MLKVDAAHNVISNEKTRNLNYHNITNHTGAKYWIQRWYSRCFMTEMPLRICIFLSNTGILTSSSDCTKLFTQVASNRCCFSICMHICTCINVCTYNSLTFHWMRYLSNSKDQFSVGQLMRNKKCFWVVMSWWPISYSKRIKWILIKYIELFIAR